MKTPLRLIFGVVLISLQAHSQGIVQFNNYALTVDAPVTNDTGVRILGPGPYIADLFWSNDTNAPTDSLTAAGFNQPFSTTTLNGGGYFFGGTRTVIGSVYIILAQVRVWDTTHGATYAQARDNGGEFGFSNPISVPLAISPTAPGAFLTGLQGFQLGIIPEPSTAALTFIGGAALFFWRRRKNNVKPGAAIPGVTSNTDQLNQAS